MFSSFCGVVKPQLSFALHCTCTVLALLHLVDQSDISFWGDWNDIVVTKPFVFAAAPLTFGFVFSVAFHAYCHL